MEDQFSRTRLLIGQPALETLKGAKVAVFGIGGVGGYVAETLARSGIGALDLFDNDTVSVTNLNRQIYALHSTLGLPKVEVAANRILDINPLCTVGQYKMFYLPENADKIDLSLYDYVVDCIDTITAKLELIKRCHTLHVPIISSMGAAYKLDASAFRVADINKTQMDPLAKVIRKKLRKLGIPHLKVVYSEEKPLDFSPQSTEQSSTEDAPKKHGQGKTPASIAFAPAAAGIIIGGEVVCDLIQQTV